MTTQSLPKHLYKYRAFNVHTLRMLTDAEVYYANPLNFNDPLDSKPSIQVDTDNQSLEDLLFRMLIQSRGEKKANDVIANHRYMSTQFGDYRKDQVASRYYTQALADSVLDLLQNDFGKRGILSLAEKWNCPLMWSHYADMHRGVCIEYDTSKNAFEGIAPVNYRKPRSIKISDLIEWKVNRSDSAEQEVLRTFFLVKAPQWRYEKEWRDIADQFRVDQAPAQISAIYFGLRCDSSVVESTVKLHAPVDHQIKFFNVYVEENSFQLKRRSVDVDEIVALGPRSSGTLIFQDAFDKETAAK